VPSVSRNIGPPFAEFQQNHETGERTTIHNKQKRLTRMNHRTQTTATIRRKRLHTTTTMNANTAQKTVTITV
jgi:hypothetical protein